MSTDPWNCEINLVGKCLLFLVNCPVTNEQRAESQALEVIFDPGICDMLKGQFIHMYDEIQNSINFEIFGIFSIYFVIFLKVMVHLKNKTANS